MGIGIRLRLVLLTAAALLPVFSAQAAEIRLVASPSVSATLHELTPRFESETKHKVTVFYGLVPAQKQRIEAGDFDLAVVPADVLDYEIARGKISAQTRTQIARTGLGVGIRSGTPKPGLATIDAFRQTLLGAKSVSYVTKEPSGRQVSQDFERLGIAESMKSKIASGESTKQVWEAVAGGRAELGFGFIPNVKSAAGVEFAGAFPADLQFYTVIAAGVGVATARSDAAETFIKYLSSPDTDAIIKASGFERAAH